LPRRYWRGESKLCISYVLLQTTFHSFRGL